MTFTEMTLRYRSIGKNKKCTFIFCADHGVAKMNVSAYPQSTTAGMVKNYLVYKGAAANAFAKYAGSELLIVDVGVDADISNLPGLIDKKIANGTNNIAEGPAMTLAHAKRSIKIGRDMVKKAIKAGYNCFLIGEMGIGNTTAAAAITSAILETNPKNVTGRGSNISDERLKNKIKIVRKALKINAPNPDDGLDVLKKVGGFEFGAMAGVILEASKNKCITILDGFNTSAAALIADLIDPDACEYVIASHIGREIGHLEIVKYLGLTPMFTLDLALGEAIGSSIAAKVLDSLVYTYVAAPEDDFEGDLDEFRSGNEELEEFLGGINFEALSELDIENEVMNLSHADFDEDSQIEEESLEFQFGDDMRFEPYEPPFSAQNFNVPRTYPIMIREMNGENVEMIAATDRTFNFYIDTMPELDLDTMDTCRKYLDTLTKPQKSLGLLEDIAAQFAGISKLNLPPKKIRRAALAFTNSENSPSVTSDSYAAKKGKRHNISLDFSMTARTFAMKVFLGVVDPKQNPTVAFNFGRTIGEEISFEIPIIAITDLTNWNLDRIEERFAAALLKKDGSFKVPPDEFLNYVPKKFRTLTGALIGAIVAAAHNSTFIVVDSGAVDIIARYLETICPQIRPFILHATELINFDFKPGERLGYDGEAACIAVEIVEAALSALNDMKTFKDTSVDVAVDGTGAEVQSK